VKTPQHLFADLTALLEDIHGAAVEGQHPDISADMQRALIACVRSGFRQAGAILRDLRAPLL
jgi:hypothetical protein